MRFQKPKREEPVWHRWFAWKPVSIVDYEKYGWGFLAPTIWLDFVERKKVYFYSEDIGNEFYWLYRECSK